MPVLDTVVLFGAMDDKDKHHEACLSHLKELEANQYYWIAGFALFEFDIVMKSRGFSFHERMEEHALLIQDFPAVTRKTLGVSPSTFHLLANIEQDLGIDYFDAGVASESLQKTGVVVSTDRVFDRIPNLRRIW